MAISGSLTLPPVFNIDSITDTTIVIDLTDLSSATEVNFFLYEISDVSTEASIANVNRTGTGTFSFTGLSQARSYAIRAVGQDGSGDVGPIANQLVAANGTFQPPYSAAAIATRFNLRDAVLFLVAKLEVIIWPGSSDFVFHDVIVGQFFTREHAGRINPPSAFITIGGEKLDDEGGGEEETAFRDAEIVIGVVAQVENDPFGGDVIMGGRPDNDTTSAAAGILEIQPVLYDALRKGGQSDAFRYTFVNRSRPRPDKIDNPTMTIVEYLYTVKVAESMLTSPN